MIAKAGLFGGLVVAAAVGLAPPAAAATSCPMGVQPNGERWSGWFDLSQYNDDPAMWVAPDLEGLSYVAVCVMADGEAEVTRYDPPVETAQLVSPNGAPIDLVTFLKTDGTPPTSTTSTTSSSTTAPPSTTTTTTEPEATTTTGPEITTTTGPDATTTTGPDSTTTTGPVTSSTDPDVPTSRASAHPDPPRTALAFTGATIGGILAVAAGLTVVGILVWRAPHFANRKHLEALGIEVRSGRR